MNYRSLDENPSKKSLKPILSWIEKASSFMLSKEYGKAIECYKEALLESPNDSYTLYCKGVAHHNNMQLLEAVECYSVALQINPINADAYENLAQAQIQLEMFEDALICLRTAAALNPRKKRIHQSMGRVLIRLCNHNAAIDVLNHALTMDEKCPVTYAIRSEAYRGLNQLEASISDLQKAIELDHNNPEYAYNLSFDYLLSGEFVTGWGLYETRFLTKNFINSTKPTSDNRWHGHHDISNKTLLIYPEQGLGDQIQFARYALILKGMGAKIIMPVEPPLIKLMQSLHPDIHVTTSMQSFSSLPPHDFHVPLMSLPGILNTDLESIPSTDRYLYADPSTESKWYSRVPHHSKLQIGIAWSGSQTHVNDHNRSMSLGKLFPFFNLDVDWHSLQTDIRPVDEHLLGQTPLIDWRNELHNFDETAGLIEQLDLVITVDTSVAHLSAALGKPTWIMLAFAPDFRWLLDRADSPWYPSVRLFRQPQPGDWDNVIAQVTDSLIKL